METLFSNTILKQTVDVSVTGNSDGLALQKQLDSICKHQLRPQLEKLLDKYDLSEDIISIDRLTVEVNDLNVGELESKLTQVIISKLEDELIKRVILPSGRENEAKLSTNEKIASAFIFYLTNGYFPWWAGIKNSNELYEKLDHLCRVGFTGSSRGQFLEALKSENVRQRFLKQIPSEYFQAIIDLISGTSLFADYNEIVNLIPDRALKKVFEDAYEETVLHALSSSKSSEVLGFSQALFEELKSGIRNFQTSFITTVQTLRQNEILSDDIAAILLTADKNFPAGKHEKNFQEDFWLKKERNTQQEVSGDEKAAELTKVENDNPAGKDIYDDAGIYLNNAGMVIVAPFLPMFFKDLGLSEGSKLAQVSKAVALLNFIVSGSQDHEEFESVLPKVLCGIEIEEVIEKVELDDNEKAKAEELLQSVIEHWSVLKNTSIEGLRSTFLQREGKLTFRNGQWNLLIYRQSFDVLLEHLPWSINIIKLPWMENMLIVDWV